ncbi:MAG: HpcH/HpaI aldolase/citrate lyase family protein, partial [Actinomycetes bacterium]
QDSTEALRRSGFFGRLCIHPAQIPIINEVFMASESDKARAKRILELLEISHGAATTDDSGSMIDQAHAKWANIIMENQGR